VILSAESSFSPCRSRLPALSDTPYHIHDCVSARVGSYSNRLPGLTFNAVAIRSTTRSVGLRAPRSTSDMYDRATAAMSASVSCEKPALFRAAFTFLPKRLLKSMHLYR
jgi:hypothetical protein